LCKTNFYFLVSYGIKDCRKPGSTRHKKAIANREFTDFLEDLRKSCIG
jgi:hypothetical protein